MKAAAALVPVPAFADNYIWLAHHGDDLAVVDPGDAAPVLAWLASQSQSGKKSRIKNLCFKNLQLRAILLTHHHPDHVGGVVELAAATGATVYGPARERLPRCDVRLAEGDTVKLPGLLELAVLDVPGHTAGHIAYHGVASGEPVLFCGDTLFAAGCGRLFEGTPAQMHASLQKLRALPSELQVCCAHEYTLANLRWARAVDPENRALQDWFDAASARRAAGLPTLPTTLALECQVNPFLRTDTPAVAAAARSACGQPLATPIEVFAALREWKNRFS